MTDDPLRIPPRGLTVDVLDSADGIATIVCRGQINVETSGIFKSKVKSLASDHQYVRADLSDVDFVDSAGLGDVLTAYLSARSAGCELKLIKVHPRVKDLLNLTGLASVIAEHSAS